MMLVTFCLPFFLIPLVGLAIDGARLYVVQAKLSSAVDGAALGAGRLLGTNANTSEIAGEFLNANFPAGFWGTRNLQPTISATNVLGFNTINVSATVDTPLLFMRIFGQQLATVAAAGTATRRNTRAVLVLDQSGSMSSTIGALRTASQLFTSMFTPGTDELGMVAFSGSAIVGYPIANPPYNLSPTSSGGPDVGFATTNTTPMSDQIGLLVAGGYTNTSEALAMAYIELQKAHNRDVAAGGDTNLNSIVLFTDGVPTAMSVSPNDPANNALKPFGTGTGQSPCTYNPSHTTVDAAHTMAGWVNGTNGITPTGLNLLSSTDTSKSQTYWLGNPGSDVGVTHIAPATAPPSLSGCTALGNGTFGLDDLAKIPPVDRFGNSTSGIAYTLGMAHAAPCNVTYDPTRPTSACHMGIAIWNAADNVGKTIRTQASMGSLPAPTGMLPITIFTIGYTGNGGTDAVLLKRLANTQDSTSYAATEQVGEYIQVDTAANLSAAFSQIASSLLRLAK